MKQLSIITVALLIGGSVAAHGQAPVAATRPNPVPTAGARLIDNEGRAIGDARLQQTPHGVLLELRLKNATPGIHALHIHETGSCERPSFTSAGGHFNPTGRHHGFLSPEGPHAGDLPNIEIPTTTELSLNYLVPDVTLTPGPASLIGGDGSAIVIHRGKDDYRTEPAGAAGERLACGQIVTTTVG